MVIGSNLLLAQTTTEQQPFCKQNYIKSNAVGWAMLNPNVAMEFEFSPQWTLSFPFYFSALNYFSSTVKFRTAVLQPEIRYRFTPRTAVSPEGWYIGAHLCVAWYNFALGGSTRIQDHDATTPAYGGGIAAGYVMPIGHSGRWSMEYSLGAGVYRLYYDKFYNYHNGSKFDEKQKTSICIDQVSVSVIYRL